MATCVGGVPVPTNLAAGCGLTLAGSTLSTVVDPSAENALSCSGAGLLVDVAAVALDTSCINVTVTGSGTVASPFVISAVPIIDPDPDNDLACGAAGLTIANRRHAAKGVLTNPQAIPANTGTTVLFDNDALPLGYDEDAAYNPGTGEYTAPEDGLYDLKANVNLGSNGAGNTIQIPLIEVYVNGVFRFRGGQWDAGGATNSENIGLGLATDIALAAGDKVTIRILGIATSALVANGGGLTWFSIRRDGGLPN